MIKKIDFLNLISWKYMQSLMKFKIHVGYKCLCHQVTVRNVQQFFVHHHYQKHKKKKMNGFMLIEP